MNSVPLDLRAVIALLLGYQGSGFTDVQLQHDLMSGTVNMIPLEPGAVETAAVHSILNLIDDLEKLLIQGANYIELKGTYNDVRQEWVFSIIGIHKLYERFTAVIPAGHELN